MRVQTRSHWMTKSSTNHRWTRTWKTASSPSLIMRLKHTYEKTNKSEKASAFSLLGPRERRESPSLLHTFRAINRQNCRSSRAYWRARILTKNCLVDSKQAMLNKLKMSPGVLRNSTWKKANKLRIGVLWNTKTKNQFTELSLSIMPLIKSFLETKIVSSW